MIIISYRRARHKCYRTFRSSSGETIELKSYNEEVLNESPATKIRLALNFAGRGLVSTAGIILVVPYNIISQIFPTWGILAVQDIFRERNMN